MIIMISFLCPTFIILLGYSIQNYFNKIRSSIELIFNVIAYFLIELKFTRESIN